MQIPQKYLLWDSFYFWLTGNCMQDLYGRVGVVQIHPVFVELLHAFDTRPPIKSEVDLE